MDRYRSGLLRSPQRSDHYGSSSLPASSYYKHGTASRLEENTAPTGASFLAHPRGRCKNIIPGVGTLPQVPTPNFMPPISTLMSTNPIDGAIVETILRTAVTKKVSDVHLKPGSPPKMRKGGQLIAVPGFESLVLTPAHTEAMGFHTYGPAGKAKFDEHGYELDYGYELEGVGRWRMHASKIKGAIGIVGRLIVDKPQTLAQLGISKTADLLAQERDGLVLVTGATGSGKSSTMAGMINLINSHKAVHIVSLEEPIEILHTDAKASVSQREVGQDTKTFATGVRAALREDPDVILIGEVRDKETLQAALGAAETGHLVITTLHTGSAAEAFSRMLGFYDKEEHDFVRQLLSSTLKGIICQRLLPSARESKMLVNNEVLVVNRSVQEALLRNEPAVRLEEIMADDYTNGKEKMMITFDQHLLELYESGDINLATARANAGDKSLFPSPQDVSVSTNTKLKNLTIPVVSAGALPALPPTPRKQH